MGYLRKRYSRGMGDTASDIYNAISSVSGTVGTAASVVGDPYFAEVVCRINQLRAVEAGQPANSCVDTPPGGTGGVGLKNVAIGLRGYVWAEQHRWIYPVAIALLVGLPMYFGYEAGHAEGRRARRPEGQ